MPKTITKAEATRKAEALRKKMNGAGWKLDVWKNMGWNYAVWKGPIRVRESFMPPAIAPMVKSPVSYHATITDNEDRPPTGAPATWYHNGSYDDPNEAVKMTLEAVKEYVRSQRAALAVAVAAVTH